MKILVGCEYSGRVRDAFIKLGHDAISADLLPTDVDGPHYHGDVYNLLNDFGQNHWQWDLIIMHPPCTYVCVAGNKHYGKDKLGYHKRTNAAHWTRLLWERCKRSAPKVCFENPVSVLSRLAGLPKAKYVQPYGFGHLERKKTGLHLHNLEPLVPTNDVFDEMMKLPKKERERVFFMPPSEDRWKLRSTTYQGIADAMAEQWG